MMSVTSLRQPLKSLDDALAELLGHAVPLDRFETVSTFDADGRVLAQDLIAEMDVPANDNSAMDGYAVRSADWLSAATVLQVNQRIAAGSSGTRLAAMRQSPRRPARCRTVGAPPHPVRNWPRAA